MSLIDIIFQSGEFYENTSDGDGVLNYFQVFLDSIVGIIIFVLGFVIANYLSNKKTKNELTSLIDYFKLYYNNQIDAIHRQMFEMTKQQEKIKKLTNTNGTGITIINQPYFMLDSINKESLLRAWKIEGQDDQGFIEIIKFIEYTRTSFGNYLKNHQNFLKRQTEIRTQWNNRLEDFHNFKNDLNVEVKEVLVKQPNFVFLNDVYNDWGEKLDDSFKSTIDYLVSPIDDHFKIVHNETPNDKLVATAIKKVQRIELIYMEWESSIQVYDEYLTIFIDNYNNHFEKIENLSFHKVNFKEL